MMTRPRYALVKKRANELLARAGVQRAPVPVEQLAVALGAQIKYEPFDGQLSGLLHRSRDRAVIGINSKHPSVRQRFSIAHELGHLVLHQPDFQIDPHAFVAFRDRESSTATDPAEIEANQFAAAVLMPEFLLEKHVKELGPDPDLEEAITILAKRFGVSEQAMTIRLTSMGWLTETA
jgi:Zn-dependent peptidase ImmA (M78 family)